MKVPKVNKYGKIELNDEGGVSFIGWQIDDAPEADTHAKQTTLMLREFLIELGRRLDMEQDSWNKLRILIVGDDVK